MDGVRAIAMMWVVIGHTFSFFLSGNVNLLTVTNQVLQPAFLIISAGLF